VPQGDALVCDWQPEPHHEAFAGTLNGGIIGALLDCHGNWAAAWHLMNADALAELPSTVTSEFHVKLLRPTPTSGPVHLTARVVERAGNRVTVEETLEAGGKVTATCRGVFVSVPPGHPAYHRWR
jgi:acyl-coenzyme A thioesterase PaaI-like protein